MKTTIIILSILVALLYLKWVLIILVFPFQVVHGQILKRWGYSKDTPVVLKVLKQPYKYWEKIFRQGWQRYMLYQVGLVPSCRMRRFVYRCLGAEIGRNVVFHYRTEIRGIHRLKVGAGSIIGDNVLLDARQGLDIGENVNISSNVSVYNGGHDYRDPYFRISPRTVHPVTIGDRVWIGSNAIIVTGVNIGEGAVCCAGCAVTKDVEPYAVVAGIPAKKVRERPRDLRYVFDGKSNRLY